jgi:hypothetical protein
MRILPSVVHVRYEIEELLKMLGKRKKMEGSFDELGRNSERDFPVITVNDKEYWIHRWYDN